MSSAVDFFVRPMMQALSVGKKHTAKNAPRPPSMAHSHASGPWPLQILFVGCGIALGDGVLTHDLAIPGHLARMLASDTARGVDVDVVAYPDMTPSSAWATLSRIRVSHYDAIVILLGAADAENLTPPAEWAIRLEGLLAHIGDTAQMRTQTFVVTLPTPSRSRPTPVRVNAMAERHSRRLNAAMADACAATPGTTLVTLVADPDPARTTPVELFRAWSGQISVPMAARLTTAPGSTTRRIEVVDEAARQRAIDELSVIDEGAAERLDRITELARQAFGVASSAVTIIDGDWQLYASRQNMPGAETPRADALCAVTITGRDALVVPDASIDPRFAHNPLVIGAPHVRFYAGYPLEAPNGERVGALCVLHPEPRQFSEEDVIKLRTLALFAQDELWSEGYHYERDFGQRTGDIPVIDLLESGSLLR